MNERQDREPPSGKLTAKLITYDLGMASTGAEQIGVLFEFTDGPWNGEQITWYGSFSPAAFPITVKGLSELGWSAERVDTLRAELKPGTVVQLVCEVETYEGRKRTRVKFINRRGLVRMDRMMTPEQRKAFSAEVQLMLNSGLHKKPRDPSAAPNVDDVGDDDIPF
jgi:hypothetical protein